MELHPNVKNYLDEVIENKDLVLHLETKKDLNAIARSGEKFLHFKTGFLNFKDSLNLLLSGLDELI